MFIIKFVLSYSVIEYLIFCEIISNKLTKFIMILFLHIIIIIIIKINDKLEFNSIMETLYHIKSIVWQANESCYWIRCQLCFNINHWNIFLLTLCYILTNKLRKNNKIAFKRLWNIGKLEICKFDELYSLSIIIIIAQSKSRKIEIYIIGLAKKNFRFVLRWNINYN